MNDERLTDRQTWNEVYRTRESVCVPFVEGHWREYASTQALQHLQALGLAGRRVLEVGGGDSTFLTFLARKYPDARFSALDYSSEGCERLRARAGRESVSVAVHEMDLFDPAPSLLHSFDVVYSLGVVEHFNDLPAVLAAKKRLLAPGGRMFSLIPNLSSPLLRWLMRRWSPEVYDLHVPHDWRSFLGAHAAAGLSVVEHGYVGSTEFGMLSIAADRLDDTRRADRLTYLWLTRLSKAAHLFECRAFDLPTSRLLSPFMYAIGQEETRR
ncbi:MAG: class I SAM-dependent methyltransferase [Chromatiales bacterium]|nr:class I SAM-dependent methyltransferase [Chromatiales bacterium]